MYVDGVKVGTAAGGAPTPHLLISRLCEGETSESDGTASALLGWRQALPPLPPGRHEVLCSRLQGFRFLLEGENVLCCHELVSSTGLFDSAI